jgi:uncharacterized integral membrane protein (TIGR00698 family)
MKQSFKTNLPGFMLSFLIALLAYYLGTLVPVVGGPVLGITIGILVTTLWALPASTGKGIKFTSKYILQLAVILLGFDMNMANIIKVGGQSLLVLLVTMTAAFVTVFLAGKYFSINRTLSTLIGVGTAICGGSAIAAASSAIDADDQDISYAISTIFLFNVIAVFLFPAIGHLLKLSDTGFGMWAGTAINDTSSVVAAGFSYSDAAGTFATIVKLTRSLMIVPVTLALAIIFSRQNKNENHFNFVKVFPWFILGFILAAVIRSVPLLPVAATGALAWAGKFLIITAMAAIGLNTNVRMFIKAGPKALFLGAMTWFAVAVSSLAIQFFSRMI